MSYYLADLGARRKKRAKPMTVKSREDTCAIDVQSGSAGEVNPFDEPPSGYHFESIKNLQGQTIQKYVRNGMKLSIEMTGGSVVCVSAGPSAPAGFVSLPPPAPVTPIFDPTPPPASDYPNYQLKKPRAGCAAGYTPHPQTTITGKKITVCTVTETPKPIDKTVEDLKKDFGLKLLSIGGRYNFTGNFKKERSQASKYEKELDALAWREKWNLQKIGEAGAEPPKNEADAMISEVIENIARYGKALRPTFDAEIDVFSEDTKAETNYKKIVAFHDALIKKAQNTLWSKITGRGMSGLGELGSPWIVFGGIALLFYALGRKK